MRMQSHDPGHKIIREQAAQWLCDLREHNPDRQTEFFSWIRQSPRHVEEFLLATALWRGLDDVGPASTAELDTLIAAVRSQDASTNVVSLKAQATTEHSKKVRYRPRYAAAAAIAGVALITGAVSYTQFGGWQHYRTAVGEQRALRLSDGSILHLNTRTRVDIRFSDKKRDIRLLDGEALFTVEHDAARPFRVQIDDHVIQALGTQFDVYRRHTDAATVSVLEGAVQISHSKQANRTPQNTNARELAKLKAGEQASIATDGLVAKVQEPNVAAAIAWRERRLVFRGERLEDIAAEFNRYTAKPIRTEGTAAKNKRLAGTFDADDPQSLVLFLKKYDDLTVESRADEFVIRDR